MPTANKMNKAGGPTTFQPNFRARKTTSRPTSQGTKTAKDDQNAKLITEVATVAPSGSAIPKISQYCNANGTPV